MAMLALITLKPHEMRCSVPGFKTVTVLVEDVDVVGAVVGSTDVGAGGGGGDGVVVSVVGAVVVVVVGVVMHMLCPVKGLYVPTGHGRHAASEVDPVNMLYVPIPHDLHAANPGDDWSLYVPAMQWTQANDEVCAVRGLYLPSPHDTQAAMLLCPVSALYVPTGQLRHSAWPVNVLYVPAGQSLHVD